MVPAKDWKYLNLICWSLLLIGFVFPLSMSILHAPYAPNADFSGFYGLGRILNEHRVTDLYNYEAQKQIYFQICHKKSEYGPIPYPPMVGLLFRPFALLPVWYSYLLWILLSAALYSAGLKIVIARIYPRKPMQVAFIFFLAFAYSPFIVDTAFNGQFSAIGFFALAMALYEDDLGRQFRSGVALSLCVYKPTLLVLVLPMLLVTRRFKALSGFAAGACGLVFITTVFEGFSIWPAFLQEIFSYGRITSSAQSSLVFNLSKFVDFRSFYSLFLGGRAWWLLPMLAAGACCAFAALLWFWWESPHRRSAYNRLLWAATVTWTLLINDYTPIYDSILVVLAVLATASALAGLDHKALHKWFTVNWILIFICSWFTVHLAAVTGFQLMTLLLAALGILQFAGLKMLRGISNPSA